MERMNLKRYGLAIMAILLSMLSLTSFAPVPDKDGGKIEPYQGIYVFYLSKPISKYDYIGTFKIKVSMSGAPRELLNIAIKKVKKEYPTANAIIFTNTDMDQIDAVLIKE